MSGFGFKKLEADHPVGYMTPQNPGPVGFAWQKYRPHVAAPLTKWSPGGGIRGPMGADPGGGGGGNNLPLGCPKCVGWYWVPLGALGVMQLVAWLLARK